MWARVRRPVGPPLLDPQEDRRWVINRFLKAAGLALFFSSWSALAGHIDWQFPAGIAVGALCYQVAHRLRYGSWFG